ncbi:serpin family protein [Roseofilum casamattae]|uniref:Serpin family protein n=1 Tax=Roseofilum casamattae BLCC-M143 TaxID=3022442 RepID=A0ABT7BVH2_9CYAN|nr:serpin family protein [Roseofilum casamattae]MDJ1183192.1 serpin family protein [Roseofilum casamattae BLCC-M143]
MMQLLTLKKLGTLLSAGLVLLGLWGCFRPTTPGAIASPSVISQIDNTVNADLADGNRRFSFKLWKTLLAKEEEKNVFISPASIAIALTMTYNGASGETQTAMAKALELQGLSLDEINQGYAHLQQSLQHDNSGIELSLANSLWGREDIAFDPQFIDNTKTFYNAHLRSLDFSNPKTKQQINGWVKQHTKGKIPEILDRVNSSDLLFLINATYFKGEWQQEFNEELTRDRTFYLAKGKEKQHPMMFQTGTYDYLETDEFQAARLPYGNGRLSFYVFLPKEERSLSQFYQTLDDKTWQTWIGQFSEQEGSIALPKFKLEYGTELSPILSSLGMEIAFHPGADFSAMMDADGYIDRVKHKTFVEVNETGTEAAAATAIAITETAVAPTINPFQMVVNRPFFCAIYDSETDTPLFLGSITNPE